MARTMLVSLLVLALSFGAFAYATTLESHHFMGSGAVHHVCPLLGGSTGCVSALEHLAHFQLSFTAVIGEFFFVVLLISSALVLSWLYLKRIQHVLCRLRVFHAPLAGFLLPRHTLTDAFSRGIIHPKLF